MKKLKNELRDFLTTKDNYIKGNIKIETKIIKLTSRAVLIDLEGRRLWIPKSQIIDLEEIEYNEVFLTVTQFIYENNIKQENKS